MKSVLPFALLLIAVAYVNVARAQSATACAITQVGVQVTATKQESHGCTVTANVSFMAKVRNSGQKFVTIHLWEKEKRPANLSFNSPPNAAMLANALRTIVIEDKGNGAGLWQVSNVYDKNSASSLVNISNVGLVTADVPSGAGNLSMAFKDYISFTLRGVTLKTTNCSNLQLVADVWGAQNSTNSSVVCANTAVQLLACQMPGSYLPAISGSIACAASANSFSLVFNNANGCQPYLLSYRVVADANRNGIADAADPVVSQGAAADYVVLNAGETETQGPFTFTAANNPNLIITAVSSVTVNPQGGGFITQSLYDFVINNGCSLLPVQFQAFSAKRNEKNSFQIDLAWETALEHNNKGFHVQRKTGGDWKTIAFVFSAADGGNSAQVLRYSFKDVNNYSGTTQYRLLQEDLDGRATYSEIKAVQSSSSSSALLVYPNPAAGGKATVLFADEQPLYDVWVSDIAGRLVKQYFNIADNTLELKELKTGFYTIKAVSKRSHQVLMQKIVVQ